MIAIIVAMGNKNEIGINNALPWRMPADLAYFKKVTTGHKVIMGRKTYESIGRPLPNRENIVLTRKVDYDDERVTVIHSLKQIEAYAHSDEMVFVIGGAEIFKEVLPYTQRLYVTEIHGDFDADTYFPMIKREDWNKISDVTHESDEKNTYSYTFVVYEKRKQ